MAEPPIVIDWCADVEVRTEPAQGWWLSQVIGGILDGLRWPSKTESEAIDHHVLLVKIVRSSQQL